MFSATRTISSLNECRDELHRWLVHFFIELYLWLTNHSLRAGKTEYILAYCSMTEADLLTL